MSFELWNLIFLTYFTFESRFGQSVFCCDTFAVTQLLKYCFISNRTSLPIQTHNFYEKMRNSSTSLQTKGTQLLIFLFDVCIQFYVFLFWQYKKSGSIHFSVPSVPININKWIKTLKLWILLEHSIICCVPQHFCIYECYGCSLNVGFWFLEGNR